jgi:hypothetical protein
MGVIANVSGIIIFGYFKVWIILGNNFFEFTLYNLGLI